MSQSVYVLHSPSDQVLAARILAYLQAAGVSCVEDAETEAWSILLLILSREADESAEILRQVSAALADNKILIPFRVENFRPGGEMQDYLRWRYVHDAISAPLEPHLEELVRMIKPLFHGRPVRLSEATSISRTLPSRVAILQKPSGGEGDRSSGGPVQVSLNFPHLVLAGFPTTIQCRVENAGSQPLLHVRVLVECRGLKHAIDRSVDALPAGGRETLTLEIEPGGFGQFNLRINLQWQQGEEITSSSGVHPLRIHEAPLPGDFPDVLQRFAQDPGYTASSQGDLLEFPSIIASADELSRFKLPDRFEPLDLALDHRVPDDLEFSAPFRDRLGRVEPDLEQHVAAMEGWLAGEQLVERGAKSVDVVGRARDLAIELLRTHVGECAAAAGAVAHRAAAHGIGHALRNPEIGDLELTTGRQHQVGGFEIAMDDAGLAVCVLQALADRPDPAAHFLDLEDTPGLLDAQFGQRFAVHEFHRNGGRLLVLDEVINADDVRMREVQAALGLALEFVERRGVEEDIVRKKLEGHVAVQLFIVREPDDPHAAATEDSPQIVAPEDPLTRIQPANRHVESEVVRNGEEFGSHRNEGRALQLVIGKQTAENKQHGCPNEAETLPFDPTDLCITD